MEQNCLVGDGMAFQSLKLMCVIATLSITFTSCKRKEQTSEVQGAVKVGGKSMDLTTFKGATPAMVTAMKKEITTCCAKPYPYDKQVKDQKAFLIKSKKKAPVKLTEGEMVGLWLYTSGPFKVINTGLRSGSNTKMQNTIKVIASALNKLPAKSCTVYRGAQQDAAMKKIAAQAIKTGFYTDNAFSSSSVSKKMSEAFAQGRVSIGADGKQKIATKKTNDGILFAIKSSSCRDLTWTTLHDQGERLFAPGAEFKVLPTSQKAPVKGKMWLIHLQQVASGSMAKGSKKPKVVKLTEGTSESSDSTVTVVGDEMLMNDGGDAAEGMSLTSAPENSKYDPDSPDFNADEAFADSPLWQPIEESNPNGHGVY